MQIHTSSRNRKKMNIIARCIVVLLMCAFLLPTAGTKAYADVSTDTLTIKVGYTGMQLSEYVEVGNYHWRDLANNMSLHKVAYSYFQQSSKKKYTAIVDSARGFYISDLLSFANIYYGDVKSLKFYVEDHKGIRTSFDRGSLFKSRYYYEDLAGHRTVVYDTITETKEVTEIVHHDAEYEDETYTEIETIHHDAEKDSEGNIIKEAWDEKKEVTKTRQKLVKEAWDEEVTKTVTEEVPDKSKIIEYTFENAKKHAKSVQPMLAIEDNWAQFSEEFEHIGPDFSSMNAGTRFRLLFGQTSPTESSTSRSDKYVSCVYVTLDGQPTVGEMGGLNGKFGSHEVSMTVSADNVNIRNALSDLMNINSTNTNVLVITGVKVTPDKKYSDLAKVTVSYDIIGEGEASITAGVGKQSDPIMTSESVKGQSDPKKDSGSSEGAKGSGSVDNNNKKTDASNNDELKKERKAASQITKNGSTFRLSDQAAEQINTALQPQTEVAAYEEITEVEEKDNTKEEKDKQKKILIFIGLGCLGVGLGGGVAEVASFNIRLRGRKFGIKK